MESIALTVVYILLLAFTVWAICEGAKMTKGKVRQLDQAVDEWMYWKGYERKGKNYEDQIGDES